MRISLPAPLSTPVSGFRSGLVSSLILSLSALLLSACVSGPAARVDPAVYDLGRVEALPATPLALSAVDVHAPSWLDSRAMQYRRSDEPARRQNFTESRWAATPAELLAVTLRQQLGAAGGEGCRLRVELEEWIQVFDNNGQSRQQLAAQVALRSSRSDSLIDRRGFSLEQAAGTSAREGVSATIALEKQLAAGIQSWLQSLPKSKDLAARCKA